MDRLVSTEVGQFYFITNPLTITRRRSRRKAKVVYILNVQTNEAIKFESLNAISRHFGWKRIEGTKFLDTNHCVIFFNNPCLQGDV